MAKTKYGFSGLNTNLNPQLSNTIASTPTPPSQERIFGRVKSIVLDSSHPQFEEVGKWTGLGVIYFTLVTDYSPSLIPAWPNPNFIKRIPAINEIVVIEYLPGDLNISSTQKKAYYTSVVNIFNNINNNAFPTNPDFYNTPKVNKNFFVVEAGSPISRTPPPVSAEKLDSMEYFRI